MDWWSRLTTRIRVLFSKDVEERELDREIRFHLEMEARQLEASGADAAEAERQARLAFGGVEKFKEEARDARGGRLVDDLRQDLRLAVRTLPRQPAFLLAVLATLAVGIGGAVAMVEILNTSLFRSLPYNEADRLVLGRVTFDGELGFSVSGPDYFDTRDQTTALSDLAALTPFVLAATLSGSGTPERVRSPLVSTNLFRTLGVDPQLGRAFADDEGELGAEATAILAHGYWQNRFAGNESIVGQQISLDGVAHTVIGVMPAGFRFLIGADVWRPLQKGGDWAQARQFQNFVLVGRLAPEISVDAAQAEVYGISERLAEIYPATNEGKGMALTPLRDALVENFQTPLGLLTGAVVLLLFVSCANVAGLALARGGSRRSEMAVRSILGAGRDRLARQLMTENALMATLATPLALVVALWLQQGILVLIPLEDLGALTPGLSLPMVAVAFGLSLGTLSLFGTLPALRLAGERLAGAVRDGTRTTDERRTTVARNALVVAQVAMTLVLLVTAGLLLRSVGELRRVDPGFSSDSLLTAEVQLPSAAYSDVVRRGQLFAELRERVAALPGVEAVGLASKLPIRDSGNDVRVAKPEEWQDIGSGFGAFQRMVMPGYFSSMKIPLLAGRDISDADQRDRTPNVVILSESLAADLFPDRSPLGLSVGVDIGEAEPWLAEVVGVVGDVVPTGLAYGTEQSMYFSYYQRSPSSVRLAIRTAGVGAVADVVAGIRSVLVDLDPDVPISGIATMDEVLEASLEDRRAVMVLLIAFAAVALLLSAVGLYGVLAYQVACRRREIGVRLALGALPRDVAGWTLRGGMKLVGLGVLLGMPIAFLAGRGIGSMLFGVATIDLVTYLTVVLFLVVVGSAACLLPSRRAASVDPVEAFRAL